MKYLIAYFDKGKLQEHKFDDWNEVARFCYALQDRGIEYKLYEKQNDKWINIL